MRRRCLRWPPPSWRIRKPVRAAFVGAVLAAIGTPAPAGRAALALPAWLGAMVLSAGGATVVLERRMPSVPEPPAVVAAPAPDAELPDYVELAFVAAEDANFYAHDGFDLQATARAMFHNAEAGAWVQGGSTLTQQLAKRMLDAGERNLGNKALELVLARRLEEKWSKEQILAAWLRDVYLGDGAVGLEAGARLHFGKGAAEFTLGEAALLAQIPASPEAHVPSSDPEAARIRRDAVLARMVSLGWVPPQDAALAREEPIRVRWGETSRGRVPHLRGRGPG